MDVILDANAYLSDIRTESVRFKNLFDYLRRTGSRLILPRIVREEVVHGYMRELETQAKKVEGTLSSYNRLALDQQEKVKFSRPDVKRCGRKLRKKLTNPTGASSMVYYPSIDGVDLSEVFLRAVNRRRPASDEGEELRDVIVWLIVLQYPRSTNRQVAFISADSVFWDKEAVHPDIMADIEKTGGSVSIFRSIESFVKDVAPAPRPIDPEYLAPIFDVATHTDQITSISKDRISQRLGTWSRIRLIRFAAAHFLGGNLYEIDADTQFAELLYSVSFDLEAESSSPGSWVPSQLGTPLGLPGGFGYLTLPDPTASGGLGVWNVFGGLGSVPIATPSKVNVKVRQLKAEGNLRVSLRIVRGVASDVELDSFEIARLTETGTPEIGVQVT